MKINKCKILLIDDETDTLDFLSYNLRKEGFCVFVADNGVSGIKIAEKELPDLILLDIMMNDMDGVETCNRLRKIPTLYKTIIVILSARNEDYSQIAAYNGGADDYIVKPIKPNILIIKIKALLTRQFRIYEKQMNPKIINIGDITIDREKYMIIINNENVFLPKKEFEILCLLSSKPNNVFQRKDIYYEIWGNDSMVNDRTIDVHISKLRDKIGDKKIITIKGVGYKYEP